METKLQREIRIAEIISKARAENKVNIPRYIELDECKRICRKDRQKN